MSGFESRNQQGNSTSNSIAGGLGGQLGLQNTSLLQQQLLQAAGAGGGSMNGLQVRTPTPSHFALVSKLRLWTNTMSKIVIVPILLTARRGGWGGD